MKFQFLSFFLFFFTLIVVSQNQPPEITLSGNTQFCGQATAIINNVTITDPDITDTTLDSVFIQILGGYSFGQDILLLTGSHPNITSNWSNIEGKLILNGPATFTEFETAIENVVFQTNETNFSQDREFIVNLGLASYLPATQHYYLYVPQLSITWTDAKVAAENMTFFGLQGYLATITTTEESLLAGEQSIGTGWIGATDEETESTWKWVTGPEAGTVFWQGVANGSPQNGEYSFWNVNEPNNFGGNEDYAHITDPSVGALGSWNDLPNQGDALGSLYHPQGYLVEFGGFPGEPVINLSASTNMEMPSVNSITEDSVCVSGIVNLSVTTNADEVQWFDSQTATIPIFTGLSYSPSITATTTFWVAPIFNGCIAGAKAPVIARVNTLPDAIDISLSQCDDSSNDGFSAFNINANFSEITNGETNDISINYFEDLALTIPINGDNYTNNQNPQIVYAQVINTVTNCTNVAFVELQVNNANGSNAVLETCDDSQEDGLADFNLTDAEPQLLSGLPTGLTIEYYSSFEDASLENNNLPSTYTNIEAYSQTIFARLDQGGNCFGIAEVLLTVNELPIIDADEEVYYCLNDFPENIMLLSTVIDTNAYSFSWSNGETTPSIMVNTTGVYTLTVTNNTTTCSKIKTITVLPSNIATIESIDVIDVSQNNSITISVLNDGEYQYQYALDSIDGPYQDSNVFYNVTANVHTVYVKDVLNDCGIVDREVSVLGYPNYFTPNGDDINETWKIKGLPNDFDDVFVVNIYDRFGKLLYAFKDKNDSWDGRYNGVIMPTSDYWFAVFIGRGKNFKGHFALKR